MSFWSFITRFIKPAEPHEPIKPTPMTLISPEQLQEITDTLSSARCLQMVDLLNELCQKYEITDKGVFAMFLANLLQESGEMNHKTENMNYKAERIVAVWPSRFKDVAAATPFAHNPEALANKVYGGQYGNRPGTNDGWLYSGGGYIGLTFRDTYSKYADYIGKPIEEAAKLTKTDDRYALDSACWFFAILKKLIPVALTGNFAAVCSLINTGTTKKPAIGIDVRQKYFERCKKVIV